MPRPPAVRAHGPLAFAFAMTIVALLLTSCGGAGASGGHEGQGAPSATPVASPSSTNTATTQQATGLSFTCTTATSVSGSDTVAITLRCNVSGAASGETAFAAQYSVKGSTGTRVFSPTCSGKLSGGQGSCAVRYTTPVALSLGAGLVSGTTTPGNQRLGPTTPKPVPATPVGTPIAPFPTFTIQA